MSEGKDIRCGRFCRDMPEFAQIYCPRTIKNLVYLDTIVLFLLSIVLTLYVTD